MGDPGRAGMFDEFSVYERGAMTLQALRDKIGDDAFFRVLRTWTAEHFQGNATTAQFIALSERISGQDCSIHLPGGLMLADTNVRMDFLRMAVARGPSGSESDLSQ